MTGTDDNLLGLPPLELDPPIKTDGALVHGSSSTGSGRGGTQIGNVIRQQEATMDAITIKTRHAMLCVVEIGRFAGMTFAEIADSIMRENAQAKGKTYELHSEEFNQRLLQEVARDIHALLRLGSTGIAREVFSSTAVPKRSLTDRFTSFFED